MVTNNYARPGVYTNEQLNATPVTPTNGSPSNAAFSGEHWFGVPGLAVQCNSWADFVKFFGGFNPNPNLVLANPYLAYAVYAFFANGGTTAFVDRVVPSLSPPTAASVQLVDNSATPQNMLKLVAGAGLLFNQFPQSALYPTWQSNPNEQGNVGLWGNNLYVDVVAGSAAGRFGLIIYYGGHAATNQVEVWSDMSMVPNDPRYALTLLNSSTAGSLWVYAVNDSDPGVLPQTGLQLQTGARFSGGSDVSAGQTYVGPSAADRALPWTYGLTPSQPFDSVPGSLNMAAPGEINSVVTAAMANYAAARPYSFVLFDVPSATSGETTTTAINYAAALSPASSYMAAYWPWLLAPDYASSNVQATKLLPPSGFVLGKIASTDTAIGPWQSPAGVSAGPLAGVVGAERLLSPQDQGNLNTGGNTSIGCVNAIWAQPTGRVLIWGARTLNPAFSSLYIAIRRMLNYIEATLVSSLNSVVFDPNDSQTWSEAQALCNSFLTNLYNANALAGDTPDQAFYVTCDDTNNTPQSIAQGILNITVGVALEYPAEFVVIAIQQINGVSQLINNVPVTA